MSKEAMKLALRVALENLDSMESLGPTTEAVIDAAQKWYLAEQPAPMIRGDIRDGLVDDEPAQQEPVKTQNEFEQWCSSSGHDYCFDLNEIGEYQWADAQGAYEAYWARNTSPQAQPARNPLTREQVKDLLFEAGYVGAEESADFINGLRHGEVAHGIKGDA